MHRPRVSCSRQSCRPECWACVRERRSCVGECPQCLVHHLRLSTMHPGRIAIGLLIAAACLTCAFLGFVLGQRRPAQHPTQRMLWETPDGRQLQPASDMQWHTPAGRFSWSGPVPGMQTTLEQATLGLTVIAYYYAAMRLARSQQQANLIGSALTWCAFLGQYLGGRHQAAG